ERRREGRHDGLRREARAPLHRPLSSAGAQERPSRIVVRDDEGGVFERLRLDEVELLSREVALPVSALDLLARPQQLEVALERAPQALLRLDCDEDVELPEAAKLRPLQEDAVEDEQRIGGSSANE